MNNILRPGAGVLFMKVGTHANESLEDIVHRKQREIEAEGFRSLGVWWQHVPSDDYGSTFCRGT